MNIVYEQSPFGAEQKIWIYLGVEESSFETVAVSLPRHSKHVQCPDAACRHSIMFVVSTGACRIDNLDSFTVDVIRRMLRARTGGSIFPHFGVHSNHHTEALEAFDDREGLAEQIIYHIEQIFGLPHRSRRSLECVAKMTNLRRAKFNETKHLHQSLLSTIGRFGDCPRLTDITCRVFMSGSLPSPPTTDTTLTVARKSTRRTAPVVRYNPRGPRKSIRK